MMMIACAVVGFCIGLVFVSIIAIWAKDTKITVGILIIGVIVGGAWGIHLDNNLREMRTKASYTASSDSGSNQSSSSSRTTSKTKKKCIACNGRGEVEQWYTNDPDEPSHWETCALCHGTGYSNE